MTVDQKNSGLYQKFNVNRTDGRDAPGGDREGTEYFVLDLDNDPHAIPAMKAYIESCGIEYPRLAEDLRILLGAKEIPRK